MLEHFREVADRLIQTYNPIYGSLIVDIGSNDGTLLRQFKDAGYRVLGIDPAREIANKATKSGIETIPELMTKDLAQKILLERGPAQIVCMFNAFAHADNMGEIAEGIRSLLAPDGIFVFEAQYLLDIIDRMLIATIFHEHISHHSLTALTPFFKHHDLELISVERVPIQHGSLIGVVQIKGGGRTVSQSVDKLLNLESSVSLDKIETLNTFAERLTQLRQRIEGLVAKWRHDKATVAGYGAARSGPTLISQLGLTGGIQFIVDDHPRKVNRYSSGDGIPILPTVELCRRMPEFTVILAWVHSDKIIESNREYLDRGGQFVVLCPEARIVSKDMNIPI